MKKITIRTILFTGEISMIYKHWKVKMETFEKINPVNSHWNGFHCGSYNAGGTEDAGPIPGSGRSPGGEHGNPLQ